MNDEQLLRYSRHILLDDIGIEGQAKILDSHIVMIGAGGLGSPVALYLASAGVGHITVVDHDHVDMTNLQPTQPSSKRWWRRPMWCWTAATTLPRAMPSTRPASNTAPPWFRVLQSASMGNLAFLIRATQSRPATPVFFHPTQLLKKPAAPPWVFLRHWSALWVPCKQLRHSN